MNKLILAILSISLLNGLCAYNDEYRAGSVAKTKKAWNLPAKQAGGLTLNGMFYVPEGDLAVLTYIGGQPDKDAVMVAGIAFWASQSGKQLKQQGFKDWLYNYGHYNRVTKDITFYGVFSCAEGKWYRDIAHYAKTHGIPL